MSLSDLGETVVRYDKNAECEVVLVSTNISNSMCIVVLFTDLDKEAEDARLDLDDVKTLEHRPKLLSHSSDLVVRELTTIVQRVVDGYVGTNIAVRLHRLCFGL